MLQALLQALIAPTNLADLVREYQVNLDTLNALKAHVDWLSTSQPTAAARLGERVEEMSRLLPPPAPALGKWTLANALIDVGHYAEAAQWFGQARTDYMSTGDDLAAARMAVGHVGVLAYLGRLAEALELAIASEPALTQSSQSEPEDLRRLGKLLMNQGILHELRGQLEEALLVYERQSPIAQQTGDHYMEAQLENNRATVLMRMGAFPEALSAYRRAESNFARLNAKTDLLRLYINLGNLFTLLGHYTEATTMQEQAERELSTLPDFQQPRYRLAVLRALLFLRSQTPIEQNLLDALQQAQLYFAQSGPLLEEGLTLVLLGRCALQRNELQLGEAFFIQAAERMANGGDRTLEYRIQHGLAGVAQRRLDIQSAIQHYEKALEQIESIRHELQIEMYRAAFMTDKLDVYQDMTAFYVDLGDLERAFAVIERAKSRLVAEKLAHRLTVEANRAATTDLETRAWADQLNSTLHELDALYTQAEIERWQQSDDLTAAPLTTKVVAVQQKEADVHKLVQMIQHRQPLISPILSDQRVTLAQLRLQLGGAHFLQYHFWRDRLFALVVDESDQLEHLELVKLPDLEAERTAFTLAIDRMLALLVQIGPERVVRYLPHLLENAQNHLHNLYGMLIQPLQQHLSAANSLIIVPDGPLYYIPFHALFDGKTHLIEQHTVSYTPSATVLDLCLRPQVYSDQSMLMGYDDQRLAAVAPELHSLAQLLPSATVFLGEQATTQAFAAHAEHCRLLHLATHAAFRYDQPMLSGLHLADRRLTLAEIVSLHLNAELVVLSGCETGRGQLRGADLLSLASGFLGAGARALLFSLWRVEDASTAQLMTHFYKAVLGGHSNAAALRTAQLDLLMRGRTANDVQRLYSHPAFWAPFALIGRP